MICPMCKVDNNRVTGHGEARPMSYIRYRKCLACGNNFKTVEYYQPDLPTTVDGKLLGNRNKPRKKMQQ